MKCDECDRRAASVVVYDTPENLAVDMPYAHLCPWCAIAFLTADVCDAEGRR